MKTELSFVIQNKKCLTKFNRVLFCLNMDNDNLEAKETDL